MSRSQSSTAIRAMFEQQTSEAFLVKLKIDHTSLGTPLYFINDMVSHTDGATQEWTGYPFVINLPDDTSDEISFATLSIDNVDQQIVQTMRTLVGPPTVDLWVCLGSDIDDIVAGPFSFSLTNCNWNVLSVSGNLEYEPILNLAWPQHSFTPSTVPGLFKE